MRWMGRSTLNLLEVRSGWAALLHCIAGLHACPGSKDSISTPLYTQPRIQGLFQGTGPPSTDGAIGAAMAPGHGSGGSRARPRDPKPEKDDREKIDHARMLSIRLVT